MHGSLDRDHAMPSCLEPTKILNYHPSVEEWGKSTIRTSKLLHTPRNSSDGTCSVNSVDLLSAMHEIQNQMIPVTPVDSLFGITIGTVSRLTDFDRVMVYCFDECKCGAVVTEYLDLVASEDLLIGLYFLSSDLPQWIRELYQTDRVQILRNTTSEAPSLRYRNTDRTPSLDLMRSYLREVTPDKVKLFSALDVSRR